jgi:hypothetical protein
MANQIRPIELERALQGQSPDLAAKDAVYQLARSGTTGARERLVGIVRGDGTVPMRRRAALGLSLIDDARTALLQLVNVSEPSVLAAVLLSLARVGAAEDVRAIRTAASRLTGSLAEQGRFAELLLAHRLGLGLDVVPPIPTPPDTQEPLDAAAITMGEPQEAVNAWSRFVPNARLGFEPDPRRCVVIHCARRDVLLIPSIVLPNQLRRRLVEARAIVGASAAYEREAAVWHHDLWIFTTPTSGGVELQAWTQGGLPCYTGPGRVTDDELVFELWTTAISHLALARISGRLRRDSLTIGGTVGDRPPTDARAPAARRRPE